MTDFPRILWPRFMKVRGTFWRARRGGTEGGGRDGTRTTNEQTGLELEKEFKACDENGGGAKRAMCCIFCVSLFRLRRLLLAPSSSRQSAVLGGILLLRLTAIKRLFFLLIRRPCPACLPGCLTYWSRSMTRSRELSRGSGELLLLCDPRCQSGLKSEVGAATVSPNLGDVYRPRCRRMTGDRRRAG